VEEATYMYERRYGGRRARVCEGGWRSDAQLLLSERRCCLALELRDEWLFLRHMLLLLLTNSCAVYGSEE
jgi:hypothetical protein